LSFCWREAMVKQCIVLICLYEPKYERSMQRFIVSFFFHYWTRCFSRNGLWRSTERTPVSRNSYVCSKNFEPETCFMEPLGGQRIRSKPVSVSTKFLTAITTAFIMYTAGGGDDFFLHQQLFERPSLLLAIILAFPLKA
jgi:hypothetical protein